MNDTNKVGLPEVGHSENNPEEELEEHSENGQELVPVIQKSLNVSKLCLSVD